MNLFTLNKLFIFLLKSKEKRTKKKKPFHVSLSLHWASFRNSSMNIVGILSRNVWNLARAFQFQQELKLSC